MMSEKRLCYPQFFGTRLRGKHVEQEHGKSKSGCRIVVIKQFLTNEKHDEEKLYTILPEELVKYLAEFIPFLD